MLQIFVSPPLGAMSDACALRIGRRRPFIIATAGLALAMLLLILFAPALGFALGDTSTPFMWTMGILIAANVLLDACNSMNEKFQRCLIMDAVQRSNQVQLHGVIAAAVGLGNGCGNALASLDLTGLLGLSNRCAMFLFASLVFLVATVVALVTFPDPPALPASATLLASTLDSGARCGGGDSDADSPCCAIGAGAASAATTEPGATGEPRSSTLQHMLVFLRSSPPAFVRLCAFQFLAWSGIWPIWIFCTAYFGDHIYGGSSTAESGTPAAVRYDRGVRAGAVALGALSLTCVLWSALHQTVSRRLGRERVYVACQLSAGCALLLLLFTRDSAACIALVAVSGLAWASNNTTPYEVAAELYAQDVGLATSVLYLAQTVPQVFVSLCFGAIVQLLGDNFVAPLVIGGCCSVAAGLGMLCVSTGATMSEGSAIGAEARAGWKQLRAPSEEAS